MSMYWKSISLMTVLAVMMALGAAIIQASPAHAADQRYENHFGVSGMAYPQGVEWYAQTFTAVQNHQVTSVKLYLSKYGSPGTLTVSIRATDSSGWPTGSDLASGTTDANTLPQYGSGDDWRQVTLSPTLSLTQNTKYAIVVRATSGDVFNNIGWNASYGGGGDMYSGGAMYKSLYSGSSWTEEHWWDGSFEVWGPLSNQSPVLSNSYVTPTSGGTSTNFYYYVDYYDADGDSPSVKNIIIDGVAHAMSLYSGSSANGTYRYGPVNLNCSGGYTYHRYSFNFNDGQGHTTCLPAGCSGFIPEPDVTFTLGEAVDNTLLTWSTGGDASWYGQCDQYYWDNDAAVSGMITDNQSTWLETTVNGPGTLSFYWMVDSELNYDFLEFYIDNVYQERISGLTDWQFRSHSLSSGTHTLKWMYTKDRDLKSGRDLGWLDKVVFVVAPPAIQVTPVSLNFDDVPVGSTKDLILTVKNTGGGTLTGSATTAAPFSIVSGGSYSLGADQSQIVTIRYLPTSPGTHTGTVVFTGGAGANVPATGYTGCSGDVVALQNMTFTSGNTYNCIATTSITAGTGVTVQSGAAVNFKAPIINLETGFRVESGAAFSAKH
jgi:hypothetical protein